MAIDFMTALRARAQAQEAQARRTGVPLTATQAVAPYIAEAETAGDRLAKQRSLTLTERAQAQDIAYREKALEQQRMQAAASLSLEQERLEATRLAENARLAEQKRTTDLQLEAANKARSLGLINSGLSAAGNAYMLYNLFGKSAGGGAGAPAIGSEAWAAQVGPEIAGEYAGAGGGAAAGAGAAMGTEAYGMGAGGAMGLGETGGAAAGASSAPWLAAAGPYAAMAAVLYGNYNIYSSSRKRGEADKAWMESPEGQAAAKADLKKKQEGGAYLASLPIEQRDAAMTSLLRTPGITISDIEYMVEAAGIKGAEAEKYIREAYENLGSAGDIARRYPTVW